jgi:hypothetical protein
VILAVPAATPVIAPEGASAVATAVLLLVHVPPDVALASVEMPAAHNVVVPVIAAGSGFTVSATPLVVEQPLAVAATLYMFVPVTVGVIVVAAHVVQDSPPPLDISLQV